MDPLSGSLVATAALRPAVEALFALVKEKGSNLLKRFQNEHAIETLVKKLSRVTYVKSNRPVRTALTAASEC